MAPARAARSPSCRADQWTGAWEELDPEQALRQVLRRYLYAYGPALPHDFGRWFGLEREDARDLFAGLEPELEQVEVEGKAAWVLGGDTGPIPSHPGGSLRLLPHYDCYVLGAVPRQRLLEEPARRRVFAHGRGRFEGPVGLPVLLVDGMVAGIWERRRRAGRLEVQVEPFAPLSLPQLEQLEAEAQRIAAFFDLPAALSIAPLGD